MGIVLTRDPEVKPGDDCPFCGERVIDWGGVKHVAVPVEGKPLGARIEKRLVQAASGPRPGYVLPPADPLLAKPEKNR
jgi:hypothetical protein